MTRARCETCGNEGEVVGSITEAVLMESPFIRVLDGVILCWAKLPKDRRCESYDVVKLPDEA